MTSAISSRLPPRLRYQAVAAIPATNSAATPPNSNATINAGSGPHCSLRLGLPGGVGVSVGPAVPMWYRPRLVLSWREFPSSCRCSRTGRRAATRFPRSGQTGRTSTSARGIWPLRRARLPALRLMGVQYSAPHFPRSQTLVGVAICATANACDGPLWASRGLSPQLRYHATESLVARTPTPKTDPKSTTSHQGTTFGVCLRLEGAPLGGGVVAKCDPLVAASQSRSIGSAKTPPYLGLSSAMPRRITKRRTRELPRSWGE